MYNKKIISLFVIILTTSNVAFCQLVNFKENGKKIKLSSEYVSIDITPPSGKSTASVATPFLTAISPAIGVGVDIVKTALANRQASFTATYSASFTADDFYNNGKFSLGELALERITKINESDTGEAASRIILAFDKSTDMFRLKLKSILLTYSKARIKRSKNGKTIDISIDIKINAQWREYVVTDNKDDKGNPIKDGDGKIKKDISYSIKSAILGQSSIIAKGIKIGSSTDYSSKNDNYLYSDWFQSVPSKIPSAVGLEDKRGWYSITVTIKEANPAGLSANKLADFLKNNNSDVTSFLKALVPESK